MNSNIRLGTLFGIPFYANPSWFLVLALVTFTYGDGLAAAFPGLLPGVPLILGLTTGLLVFASVLAHELGHSFVAIRQGINVKSISLFLFGGVASLEKESETPGEAFWVAIAGPLVSFFLFGSILLLNSFVSFPAPIAAILGVLATVNFSLGAFNLIPGLPLDGGNILKAIVWKITGNPYQGVKFASGVGQAVGYLAIASGLIPLVLYGSFENIWNAMIGWFLLQNARQLAQFARVQSQLVDLVAADGITANSPIISASATLRDFVDQRTLEYGNWQRFLVTDLDGHLVGTIHIDALKAIPTDLWASTTVSELMQPIEPTTIIESQQPLMAAIEQLEKYRLPALHVINENGLLLGLLEKTAIVNLVQQRSVATT